MKHVTSCLSITTQKLHRTPLCSDSQTMQAYQWNKQWKNALKTGDPLAGQRQRKMEKWCKNNNNLCVCQSRTKHRHLLRTLGLQQLAGRGAPGLLLGGLQRLVHSIDIQVPAAKHGAHARIYACMFKEYHFKGIWT